MESISRPKGGVIYRASGGVHKDESQSEAKQVGNHKRNKPCHYGAKLFFLYRDGDTYRSYPGIKEGAGKGRPRNDARGGFLRIQAPAPRTPLVLSSPPLVGPPAPHRPVS